MPLTLTPAHTGLGSLHQAQQSRDSASTRLASGTRINSASDDAAGLALSQHLTSQLQGFMQQTRNLNDSISLLQTADGLLGSVTSNLQRFRELALQASSGILTDSDRAALNAEALQLREEIEQTLNDGQFNGTPLFKTDPILSGLDGANSSATFRSDINDSGLFELDLGTQAGASQALQTLDQALSSMDVQRANQGALQNRLHSQTQQMLNSATQAAASRSRIADTDYAREASERSRSNVLLEAGLAMQAQANLRSELVLRLLSNT